MSIGRLRVPRAFVQGSAWVGNLMSVVNTNISALIAKNAIRQNDRAMSSSMEKLATGSRITSARDDAAETTKLARTRIISQASTAMLAQANQVNQTVLSLLQ